MSAAAEGESHGLKQRENFRKYTLSCQCLDISRQQRRGGERREGVRGRRGREEDHTAEGWGGK